MPSPCIDPRDDPRRGESLSYVGVLVPSEANRSGAPLLWELMVEGGGWLRLDVTPRGHLGLWLRVAVRGGACPDVSGLQVAAIRLQPHGARPGPWIDTRPLGMRWRDWTVGVKARLRG